MARTRTDRGVGGVCTRKPHVNMEIKQRMSTRFAWLLGVVVLVSIGLLVACGTTYNSSSDGLVVIGSQGSALLQAFSFSLASGRISAVYNSTPSTSNSTCVLPGLPSSIVLDPAGAFAYAILNSSTLCPNSTTGIQAFKVNSDGTMTAVGSVTTDPNPVALHMDSAGKFLFVAEGVGGGVDVYAIGSGASLTAVPGTYAFNLPLGFQTPNFVALAATPTVFPGTGLNGQQNAVCSTNGNNAPTLEYLYVADEQNNVVWEFGVNTSTGALQNPPGYSQVQSFVADSQPAGVSVDPCNRFVYVSNYLSNKISAYTICNGTSSQSTTCPATAGGDGSLIAVSGSPFSISGGGASGPGPLLVDPFGNSLYVLDLDSNMISIFHVAPVSGSLTPGTPAVVATGAKPTSMAIRSDDSWLFVTNFTAGTLSQYSVTPASGGLSPQPAITTDTYPWGVAVK